MAAQSKSSGALSKFGAKIALLKHAKMAQSWQEEDLNMGAQLLSQLFLLALSYVDASTTYLSNILQVKVARSVNK